MAHVAGQESLVVRRTDLTRGCLAPPLTSWITFNKLLNLSVPQLSFLIYATEHTPYKVVRRMTKVNICKALRESAREVLLKCNNCQPETSRRSNVNIIYCQTTSVPCQEFSSVLDSSKMQSLELGAHRSQAVG